MDEANNIIESSLVEAFVTPNRKSRYLTLLSSRRGRKKVRDRLAHFTDLDTRFAHRLTETSTDKIVDILRKNGAPKKCYILSESDAVDAKEMDLDAALRELVGQGIGALVSCVQGKLAYYEGEEPGERYILKRI